MISRKLSYLFNVFIVVFALSTASLSASVLSPCFYDKVCPSAIPTIKRVVEEAVQREKRMGASLLRLHFHDCFVHGCDASILLDSTYTFESEKNAFPNLNSARGFNVIDDIKEAVDKACGSQVVSCADILAVAARDSVVALGGPTWPVQLGRRDSTQAYKDIANSDIPSPFMDLPALISSFKKQGLSQKDLVVLSGGHTIGFSQCKNFKNHLYNESNIDPVFAHQIKAICPPSNGDTNLAPLDPTAAEFDTLYYRNLVKESGLLHSDQAIFGGGSTDELVKSYSMSPNSFFSDFGQSMINMGNVKPLTGDNGQIRVHCAKVN